MLLEELAGFQSRLEGRPISTEEAMRVTIEQLVNSLFPVRHCSEGSSSHAPHVDCRWKSSTLLAWVHTQCTLCICPCRPDTSLPDLMCNLRRGTSRH